MGIYDTDLGSAVERQDPELTAFARGGPFRRSGPFLSPPLRRGVPGGGFASLWRATQLIASSNDSLAAGGFGWRGILLGGMRRGALLIAGGGAGAGAGGGATFTGLALGVRVASFSLPGRGLAGRTEPAESDNVLSCFRTWTKGQILRSSQRGQSGSPSTQVSLARSSSRSRNSAPRFLGTARSARRGGPGSWTR